MDKKILFIDVDDTILDFTGGEKVALEAVLTCFNLPSDENTVSIYHECNNRVWREFERGEISKPDLLIKRFSMFLGIIDKTDVSPRLINEKYFDFLEKQHSYINGALEFINKIARYYRIFLVTNGTTRIQNRRLADSGLINLVEDVFISEQLGVQKPLKEYFEIVEQKITNFDKSKCVLVGDSLTSDILGGKNYGIKTIWYNPHKKIADPIKPDYEADNFDSLYDILCEIF